MSVRRSRLAALAVTALLAAAPLALPGAAPAAAASTVTVLSGDTPETTVFPNDQFTVSDTNQLTGRRVNLPTTGCDTTPSSRCDDIALINTLDGFDVRPRVLIPFSGPIDLATVTPQTVYVERPDGTTTGLVELVLDPATNILTGTTDGYLAENARHAVVVTDGVHAADGTPVDVGPGGVRRVPFMTMTATRELRRIQQALDNNTAYTQAGIANRGISFVDGGGSSGARDVFPATSALSITRHDQIKADPTASGAFSDEQVLVSSALGAASFGFGSFLSPQFVDNEGNIPALPTTQTPPALGKARIGVAVILPETPAPAGGYPVAIFGPGFTRSKYDVFLASDFFPSNGIAVIATDPLGHAFGPASTVTVSSAPGTAGTTFSAYGRGHDLDGDGCIGNTEGVGPTYRAAPRPTCTEPVVPTAANPKQAVNLGDGLRQTVVDNMALVRAIQSGVDVTGTGGTLSTTDISYFGQSFGGIYGTMLMATDPKLTTGALNVAGGPISEIARLSGFRDLLALTLRANNPDLRNGGPGLNGFTESLPLRTDVPITAPLPGAIPIQRALTRTDWVARSGSPDAYAALLRTGAPAAAKKVIFQSALGDNTVPNPTAAELYRAGDLFDRVTLYRNDRTATFQTNPHGFLLDPRLQGRQMGQLQIEQFLASHGQTVIDPDGPGPVFEVPVADPRILDCLHYADPQTGTPYAGRLNETGCPQNSTEVPGSGSGAQPGSTVPEAPYAVLLPLFAGLAAAGLLVGRRRRHLSAG